MSNYVCVIGHGASAESAALGPTIDGAQAVIRMHDWHWQASSPRDYGVPVIACDPGAMCWDVAAHGLDAEIVRPSRDAWAARLAWTQWTIDEIESGEAWSHVRRARFAETGTAQGQAA